MARPAGAQAAPDLRVKFNVFGLFDHFTGRYMRGSNGAWYLNGGFSHIMGFAGRGNTFKSTLSGTMMATISIRYDFAYTEFHDTEASLESERLDDYRQAVRRNDHIDYVESIYDAYDNNENTWLLSASDTKSGKTQTGEEWWRNCVLNEIPGRLKEREKGTNWRITPFDMRGGEPVKVLNPWGYSIDSLSMMKVEAVEKMYDKGDAGEGELNTVWMKDAGAKAQLMEQMPNACSRGGYYLALVAHLDDKIELSQYAPNEKKLDGFLGNQKLKGVPGRQMSFVPNNLIVAQATDKLWDKDKKPEYPHSDAEDRPGNKDLKAVTFEQFRGKSGPTGERLELIFSQKQGLLIGLTNFHYLKKYCGNYGMEVTGNNAGFRLALYPSLHFTRKTVRKLLEDDAKFERAMEITACLAFIKFNWFTERSHMYIEPAELKTKIEEAGYDWDEILGETVQYWQFEDAKNKPNYKHTLTVKTLCDMAEGLHVANYLKKHP